MLDRQERRALRGLTSLMNEEGACCDVFAQVCSSVPSACPCPFFQRLIGLSWRTQTSKCDTAFGAASLLSGSCSLGSYSLAIPSNSDGVHMSVQNA